MRLFLVTAFVLSSLAADTAEAWGRRSRRRSNSYYTYSSQSYGGNWTARYYGSNPQEVAQNKANHLAELGYGAHLDNSQFGGGYREGWGMSYASAENAKWNTCFGGECLSARGSAQAWSERARCWFSINIW